MAFTTMDRRIHAILLGLLLLVVAGWVMWNRFGGRAGVRDQEQVTDRRQLKAPVEAAPKAAESIIQANTRRATAVSGADPAKFRRAYLLALDGGQLKLENTQDIEGDFASRRRARKEEEWAGMLRCRLVSAEGKVLAEEVIPAPDQLCTVLDASAGVPKPVSYVVPGPVVFQLRLPRVPDAARLEVARITDSGALRRDQPVGSISLISQ